MAGHQPISHLLTMDDPKKMSFPRKREPRSMAAEASHSGVSARAFQQLQALGPAYAGITHYFVKIASALSTARRASHR